MYPSSLNFVICKKEAAVGTAETLTSADFNVRIINPTLTYNTEVDDEAAKWASGTHAEAESVYGARSGQITFDMRLAYGASDTDEPETWAILNSCGLKSVSYTTTGVALQPLKSGDESTLTVGFYQVSRDATPSAIQTVLAGCMGNAIITCEGIGKPWLAKVTLTGKLIGTNTIANVDIPVPIDMNQNHPEKFINNTIYVDGKGVKVTKFALDPGCAVTPVIDQSDRTGYSHFAITDRKPRFSIDPLVQEKTVDDPIGDIVAGCTGMYAIDRIVVKSPKLRLCIPRAQMLPPSLAAREGLEGWNKNYKCLNNGVTGMLGDTGMASEATWELLIGMHEAGASYTGMYM